MAYILVGLTAVFSALKDIDAGKGRSDGDGHVRWVV